MVPPGIRVEASGFSLVGGTRVEGGPEPGPGAPTVYIRVQAAVSAPSQVAVQVGLGVLTGGAREPGQGGERRQPYTISWQRIGSVRSGPATR